MSTTTDHRTGSTGDGSAWKDGYVVETPYIDQVPVELRPTWLSMASVLHGQPAIDLDRPLTWLDLGAGTGMSACVVAATNPTVEVWGCDYNPSHVERARDLARRAALDNCRFIEASFSNLANDPHLGPPEVDVIVVNGVYSWISLENQRRIVEIVEQRLRPGGLAYVMYETQTGWSSMVPLAEALRLQVAVDGRRGDLAFHDAARAIAALEGQGARVFPLGPREAKQVASWPTASGRYAAHEYLGTHFIPLAFDEVHAAMSSARCTFVGAIDVIDHHPGYWAPPELTDLVTTTHDVVAREMMRDLIAQRALRQDVFRRGHAAPTPQEHEAWVRELVIVGLGNPFEEQPVPLTFGETLLDAAYHSPLVEALASGPLDVAAIQRIHPAWGVPDACMAMAWQVAAGFATPALRGGPTPAAIDGARRLNRVLIEENRLGADHCYLAAPAAGGGMAADSVEVLTLGVLLEGAAPVRDDLTRHVLDLFDSQGKVVREDNVLLHDRSKARKVIGERVDRTVALIDGAYAQLGIV